MQEKAAKAGAFQCGVMEALAKELELKGRGGRKLDPVRLVGKTPDTQGMGVPSRELLRRVENVVSNAEEKSASNFPSSR